MTCHDLRLFLVRNAVPPHYYRFGGLGSGDCFGIEETIVGWELYYSERGKRYVLGRFETEDEACHALLAEVERRMRDEQGHSLAPISGTL
jgi:hypothetical protein